MNLYLEKMCEMRPHEIEAERISIRMRRRRMIEDLVFIVAFICEIVVLMFV